MSMMGLPSELNYLVLTFVGDRDLIHRARYVNTFQRAQILQELQRRVNNLPPGNGRRGALEQVLDNWGNDGPFGFINLNADFAQLT